MTTFPFATRLAETSARLPEWQIDALYVTDPNNRRWLSGFSGSAGQLLVTESDAILITDSRYWERAENEAPAFKLHRWRREDDSLSQVLAGLKIKRLGVEAGHVTLADYRRLKRRLGEETTVVPLNETVEPLRAVKSEAELRLIRRAAAITDSVAAQIPALVRPGMAERDLSWELEKRLRESGSDGTAFPIIVASGPNAALPHHASGDRVLQRGDALIVDMGASVSGYMSDLTRSFFLGETPDAQYAAVYGAVQEAQRRALDGMRAGMTGQAVDALARDHLVDAGYGDQFGHGLGHSLGLEIHEQPRLSRLNPKRLPAGIVMTVEPGVYLPGWGGVRLEDLVLLTEEGIEMLSACPHVGLAPL